MSTKNQGKKGSKLLVPVIVILLALTLAANIAAGMFDSFLDHYLGGNPYDIVEIEGSENWDKNYYTAKYGSKEEATKAAVMKASSCFTTRTTPCRLPAVRPFRCWAVSRLTPFTAAPAPVR